MNKSMNKSMRLNLIPESYRRKIEKATLLEKRMSKILEEELEKTSTVMEDRRTKGIIKKEKAIEIN